MTVLDQALAWDSSSADLVGLNDRETVQVSVTDGVAILRLNRPEARNAFNGQMTRDLGELLRACDHDDSVRVVILSSVGSVFSVGVELMPGEEASFGGDFGDAESHWTPPYSVRKPVIAALHGHAVGAALTISLECDIRIVARDAKLAFPFARRGVVAEYEGHWNAVRLLGLGLAAELFFTGRVFSGEDAERWGLVNQALDSGDVLNAAIAVALEIASKSAPLALAVTKRLLWESLSTDRATSARRERALVGELMATPDALEGINSFLEKRTPQWQGSPSTDLPTWPN